MQCTYYAYYIDWGQNDIPQSMRTISAIALPVALVAGAVIFYVVGNGYSTYLLQFSCNFVAGAAVHSMGFLDTLTKIKGKKRRIGDSQLLFLEQLERSFKIKIINIT